MGRGKGVHAIFGTQGLADLNKVDNDFKNQVINCVNTILCHRLNDQDSAEGIAAWIGTRDAFTVTAQIDARQGADGQLGSVRVNKEYIVHPEEIKQHLKTGEAFYVSKVKQIYQDKIRIKHSKR
jgi:type IV secretory pathway TraG/TraD family ATPase VirD4